MNTENENKDFNATSDKINVSSSIFATKFILPLEMRWQPKEDITTYELAKCLPYLIRRNSTMPYEIDKTEIHFRHFEIIDHNR